MAHFAKLDENNIVLNVHVVNNDVLLVDGVESEQAGIDFLTQIHKHPYWKQTSYNGTFRKNYAGVGMLYDSSRDCFRKADSPYPSWVLNEDTCLWEAPVAKPTNDDKYVWNEETTSWEEFKPAI
jgi:hypothetical protein